MDKERLKTVLAVGETIAVEFKRCRSGISPDTFETVCSFLNRYGGDIFLGVEDNGEVSGVPKKSACDVIKNFIKMVNNPEVISPAVYLAPEIIKLDGKQIVHVRVPASSEVYTYKKVIYDRVDDSDVKVSGTGQVAAMYIRKQNVFTEKKVYKFVTDGDLRFDMLPRIRQMAANRQTGGHPWKEMDDHELIKSAGLYCEDKETGDRGYNLAAVMLLGSDELSRFPYSFALMLIDSAALSVPLPALWRCG